MDRSMALTELAPHISADLTRIALASAREISDRVDRAMTLATLASRLPYQERLVVLLEAAGVAGEMEAGIFKCEAMAHTARNSPEPQRTRLQNQALNITRSIDNRTNRAHALAILGQYISEDHVLEVLLEALDTFRNLPDMDTYPWLFAALCELLWRLPDDLWAAPRHDLMDVARSVNDHNFFVSALAELVPFIEFSELRILVEPRSSDVDDDDTNWPRVILPELLIRWAELGHPKEALAIGKAIENANDRARALIGLASHTAPQEQRAVLMDALGATQLAVGNVDYEFQLRKGKLLQRLALAMAQFGYRRDALAIVRRSQEEQGAIPALDILEVIAPHLPPESIVEELISIERTLSHLDREMKGRWLDPWIRVVARLAPQMSREHQLEFLPEALRLSQRIGGRSGQSFILRRSGASLEAKQHGRCSFGRHGNERAKHVHILRLARSRTLGAYRTPLAREVCCLKPWLGCVNSTQGLRE